MTNEDPSGAKPQVDEASGLWTYPAVLVGLIGAGIQASRTPSLHEREGAQQGLRYIYKLIDLEVLGLDARSLPEILTAAERFGFAGVNITHPCKQAVIPLLDELSPDAAALSAVNTVVLKDGRRVGHNTDWWGFTESFRRELSDARCDCVVQFGAGGAGAAVAHALLTLGAGEVIVIDIDEDRAQNLADIVYFPLETELLRQARARGCRTMFGGGMAVFQAVGAFRLFTGLEPDADRMLRHFSQM
jgi:shikimate dehydrogenase